MQNASAVKYFFLDKSSDILVYITVVFKVHS
jgi:hypothetical protein